MSGEHRATTCKPKPAREREKRMHDWIPAVRRYIQTGGRIMR